jgi:enoyl-CoA hydratase/carnithine racemase
MLERISINVEHGIADVRLIRADKMNALDGRMFDAFAEAAEQLRNNRDIRVVVLSGEGKAFCAGIDLGNFTDEAPDNTPKSIPKTLSERTNGIANLPQYAAWLWRELPVPVIAALHGVAFGGGFQVALGADIRIAAPGTRMSVMEIKWGLVPDMAGTQLMRHLAREDVIKELTYTGRIFESEEAREMGFVTMIDANPHGKAMEIARQIAQRSPDAMRGNKVLLNRAPYLDSAQGLLLESQLQDQIIGKPNQIEAVLSELEKRAADFKNSEVDFEGGQ